MTEIVTPVPITPMPAAPLLTDTQSVFNTKAFAFVAAWDAFVAQMNALGSATRTNAVASDERAVNANTSSVSAANSATAAGSARDMAQAFAQSAINAPGANGTSLTPQAVSAGIKTFWSQAGKAWVTGQSVIIARASASAAVRMYAVVLGYNATTGELVVEVPAGAFVGSGTFSDWVISLTATREGMVRAGSGVGQGSNVVHLGWANDGSGRLLATVDSTNLGGLLFDSHGMQLAPPGLFGMFFRTTVPTGWLKANGAAVSRTTYAALFAVIGTYYGAGDGSTTFNLPEMRGIFPRTWDDARGVDAGRAFGSYQAPQNQSHTHGAWSDGAGNHSHGDWTGGGGSHVHGVNDPGHAHSVTTHWGRAGARLGIASGEDIVQGSQATSGAGTGIWLSTDGYHNHQIAADGWHAHAIGVGYEGGGEARPHNIALMGCIKY